MRCGELSRNGGVDGLLHGCLAGRDVAVQSLDQELHVGGPARMRQLDAVAMGEALQALRKLILAGHLRAVHQHRDDRHLALQRRRYLQHHEVVGVIQAALAGSAGDGRP